MASRLALGLLSIYKMAVSPYMPGQCVYQPTCSEYTADAIRTRGAVRGTWLGLRRLMRCHPWSTGGYDPAPDKRS